MKTSLTFAMLLGLFPASSALGYTNLGNTCPDQFEIADLSVWADDKKSVTPHRYGGILVYVGRQVQSETYLKNSRIDCSILPDGTTEIPYRNGLPIALATSVNLRTVKLEYLRSLRVSMRSSAQRARATTEQPNKSVFEGWILRAKDKASDLGLVNAGNHTCIYDTKNPDLSGFGDYACLIIVPGMPNPNTLVACNKWNGCRIEFSLENGLSFRASVAKPADMSPADKPSGVPDAASFWEQYILDLRAAFEKVVIPARQYNRI